MAIYVFTPACPASRLTLLEQTSRNVHCVPAACLKIYFGHLRLTGVFACRRGDDLADSLQEEVPAAGRAPTALSRHGGGESNAPLGKARRSASPDGRGGGGSCRRTLARRVDAEWPLPWSPGHRTSSEAQTAFTTCSAHPCVPCRRHRRHALWRGLGVNCIHGASGRDATSPRCGWTAARRRRGKGQAGMRAGL